MAKHLDIILDTVDQEISSKLNELQNRYKSIKIVTTQLHAGANKRGIDFPIAYLHQDSRPRISEEGRAAVLRLIQEVIDTSYRKRIN